MLTPVTDRAPLSSCPTIRGVKMLNLVTDREQPSSCPTIRGSKDAEPYHWPRTALIMSHMGVKIPSASTSTMTATMPMRMGSMRAVRLLRS